MDPVPNPVDLLRRVRAATGSKTFPGLFGGEVEGILSVGARAIVPSRPLTMAAMGGGTNGLLGGEVDGIFLVDGLLSVGARAIVPSRPLTVAVMGGETDGLLGGEVD